MDMLSEEQRIEYVRIAHYYYKTGLTQEEIAERMQLSRQKVNRILKRCVELGIVQIQITGTEDTNLERELYLEETFGLRFARVIPCAETQSMTKRLGAEAAKLLSELLQDDDTIGFSRGRTISMVASELTSPRKKNLRVTQLMGSWNSDQEEFAVDDIVHRAAQNIRGSTTMLYAPVVVRDPALRDSLMGEPYFQSAYQVVRSCSIAVLGIGRISPSHSGDIPTMTSEEYDQYLRENAVGEICAHFFDKDGHEVLTEFDKRTIVILKDDLRSIPLRIGVAGGKSKQSAILAALQSGLINALVTDEHTARFLHHPTHL